MGISFIPSSVADLNGSRSGYLVRACQSAAGDDVVWIDVLPVRRTRIRRRSDELDLALAAGSGPPAIGGDVDAVLP